MDIPDLSNVDLEGEEEKSELIDTDLSTTAQAFNKTIKKKQREKEAVLSEAAEEEMRRHHLLLTSLMKMRRSLTEVSLIDLGERFHFNLIADDSEGWPRLRIKLCDSLAPAHEYPVFQVTAHDRKNSASIEINAGVENKKESISLTSSHNIQKFPKRLKKHIRFYLSNVEKIVINSEQTDTSLIEQEGIEALKSKGSTEKKEFENPNRLDVDLFEEDFSERDILETLPEINEVTELPDLDN